MNKLKNIFESLDIKPNSTIVFDIDDTLIANNNKPISDTIDFYNFLLNKNIKPVIVTARVNTPRNMEMTKRQLKSHGITKYKYLYLRPSKYNVWEYKTNARKDITNRGYNIEMSIGDKPWDIGQYGGIGVLIEKYDIKHQEYFKKNFNNLHVLEGFGCNKKANYLQVKIPGVY